MTDKDTTAKDLETRRHMLAVAMRVYLTAEDCTVDDVNVALAARAYPLGRKRERLWPRTNAPH